MKYKIDVDQFCILRLPMSGGATPIRSMWERQLVLATRNVGGRREEGVRRVKR